MMVSPGGCDTRAEEAATPLSSYVQNHIHLVFSTKGRLKLITKDIQPRLWGYIAAICKNNAMTVFAVGGMEDHVHVLFRLPPTLSLVRAVTLIKSNSSKWMKRRKGPLPGREVMARSA